MPAENDREWNLQRLAAQNARWADLQERLIETIRENKRQLEQLPGIIERLNKQLERVTSEMERSASEHDALEAEGEDDCPIPCDGCKVILEQGNDCPLEDCPVAEFKEWASDMADDYSDFLLATQPPRPNPFGLFKEPK